MCNLPVNLGVASTVDSYGADEVSGLLVADEQALSLRGVRVDFGLVVVDDARYPGFTLIS